MLNGSGILRKYINGYRILHRLPGRLRVHIPILEKLPPRWHSYSDHTAELIMLQSGVTGVNIEPVTGNLLIHYNTQKIEEEDILSWLKILVEAFLTSETPAKLKTEDDVRIRFKRLKEMITQNNIRS